MLTDARIAKITVQEWFRQTKSPYLIIDTDLRVRAVTAPYERATGHPRSLLIGAQLFDVFPDNPADPAADGVARLSESLETVFRTGCRHWMGVQRYDIPDLRAPGRFVQKIWVTVNTPILQGNEIAGVLHHVEDVTAVFTPGEGGALDEMRADAETLWDHFPGLPFEAVLGVLAHSHAVVIEALGVADPERAQRLTRLRLELLAGHPSADPRPSSIRSAVHP